MKMTRILYASDFHGSEAFYRKFLSAAMQYQASVMIVGGDVTGKAMIPVVHQGGGKYLGYLFGRKEEPSSREGLDKFTQTISNVGFYPIVLEKDEADYLEQRKEKMSERFEHEMCVRIQQWLELYEDKLGKKGIEMYFMPGNDDLYSIDAIIDQFPHVHNPDGKRFWIDEDHEIIGTAYSNVTPWHCVRDVEEPVIEQRLNEMEALLENPYSAVAALHVPPYDSSIDVCPQLDKDLKIMTSGGQVLMKPVGSTAVRKWIERAQPLLTLHGHIHESPGHVRIGKTLAINAGSEYAEGILKAAIVNIEKDKVKGHILISG